MREYLTSQERKAFVISELRGHQQKLVDFKKQFGNAAARKSINAAP